MIETDSSIIKPFITLKIATSLDGRIALDNGQSQWITGPSARRMVHELRAKHDAILVGINTVINDDPELTVRLANYDGPQPLRVVLDSRARLPLHAKIVQTARIVPSVLISCQTPPNQLLAQGMKSIIVGSQYQRVDLAQALSQLVNLGVERLMIEGGSQIATAFIKAGLIDRIEWFRGSMIMGGDAKSVFGFFGLNKLEQCPRLERLSLEVLDQDVWESYEVIS